MMEAFEIAVLLWAFCTTILVIVGNSFTIIAVLRKPKLNTISNQFIMGLAFADLLVGFSIPYDTVMTALHGDKPIKTKAEYAIFCLVSLCPIFLSSIASYLHLFLIGLDRYFAITKPLEHKTFMTKSKARYGVLIAFGIASLGALLPVIWNNFPQDPDGYGCVTVTVTIYYYFIVMFGSYISTLFFMIFMYAKIAHVASARLHSNRKPLKMFATIVSCFMVCWFPFGICMISVVHRNHSKGSNAIFYVSPEILAFTYILATCNSAMNPIIYACQLRGFRQAFSEYLRCGFGGPSIIEETTTSSTPPDELDI